MRSGYLLKTPFKTLTRSRRRWRGHVDSVIDAKIVGWALDHANLSEPIEVEALAASGKKIIVRADTYRDDLETAGFGDGRHGFAIDLSSWSLSDGHIDVRMTASGSRLNTTPLTVEGFIEPTGALARKRDGATRWRGHIDVFERDFVSGWAVDLDNTYRRLEVEAVAGSGKRVVGWAHDFRPDLQEVGYGDGSHGFKIDLRSFRESDGSIDVNIVESKFRINAQPLEFDIFKMLGVYEPPPSVRHILLALAQSVRDHPGVDVAAGSRQTEPTPVAMGATSKLFEAALPDDDPEGLISRFLQYESFRIDREKYELAMSGTLQDRLGVMMWYLVEYLRNRQFAFLLPLSAAQVRFLNGPVPLAGFPREVTIALFNVVHLERPDLINLTNPAVLRAALYWWCCERAPRDRLDASLVTKAMVAKLALDEQWVGQPFPFNVFMAEYFTRHTELHALSMTKSVDRAAFFIYLVVKSFTEPYIARFLSRDVLRVVMGSGADDVARFDKALAHLVAPARIDGAEVRRKGEALLALRGASLCRASSSEPRDTGECFLKRRDLSRRPEPGVALIGPIQKTSGLGQATRLSHDVLRAAELLAPTTLTFDLDNPAPVGFASSLEGKPYRHRREINLIHLNAESIPLVFAFEQNDIVSESYNIGYFFWELNMIPKCHRLALELLDEIWVSSEYNREIYARFTDKPVVNVGMAVEPLPKVAPMDRAALGLEPGATVFLATFDSFSFIERKNPLGVLEAFQAAFPRSDEQVQLVLKTQNRGRVFDPYQIDLWARIDRAVGEDPRILIVNETLPYRDLLALKLACDCYVSLHRSEGWGFGMLEAMNLGRPVIATAYSGNMDFCADETTFLVDYDLVGVREAEYIFVERGSQWAQPRRAHAAARMREVAADPAAARAKGEAAAVFVKRNFSIEAIARRYAGRLAEIRATRGAP